MLGKFVVYIANFRDGCGVGSGPLLCVLLNKTCLF